jgi:hypothetical protein
MLARGRVVRQSKLLFYAKMAEKALQVCGCDCTAEHQRSNTMTVLLECQCDAVGACGLLHLLTRFVVLPVLLLCRRMSGTGGGSSRHR